MEGHKQIPDIDWENDFPLKELVEHHQLTHPPNKREEKGTQTSPHKNPSHHCHC